jgi:hypothetical protein
MLNLVAIAEYLRDIQSPDALASNQPNLESIKLRTLGPVQAFMQTPALECIALRGRIRVLAGGGNGGMDLSRLNVGAFEVAIYAPLTANLESDDKNLMTLMEAYIIALEASDATLGGLVEETRATEYEFGISRRNNNVYRYASLLIYAGDLDQEGA